MLLQPEVNQDHPWRDSIYTVEDGILLGLLAESVQIGVVNFHAALKLRCISVLFFPRRCGFGKLFSTRSWCGMEVLCG